MKASTSKKKEVASPGDPSYTPAEVSMDRHD